jgi:hypothetical protein
MGMSGGGTCGGGGGGGDTSGSFMGILRVSTPVNVNQTHTHRHKHDTRRHTIHVTLDHLAGVCAREETYLCVKRAKKAVLGPVKWGPTSTPQGSGTCTIDTKLGSSLFRSPFKTTCG